MNKKTVIGLIIALLLIAVAGYFYAYVKRDAAMYNTDYTRSQMVPEVKVYDGKDFVYEFDCDKDKLTGVKLLLSCAGSETGSIDYRLEAVSGDADVQTGSLKLSKFKSGKFTFLDTDTLESAGVRYRLVISCGNSDDDAVLVAVTPDGSSTPAVCYTYIVWDLQTLIVFIFMGIYMVAFVMVLVKIFRR